MNPNVKFEISLPFRDGQKVYSLTPEEVIEGTVYVLTLQPLLRKRLDALKLGIEEPVDTQGLDGAKSACRQQLKEQVRTFQDLFSLAATAYADTATLTDQLNQACFESLSNEEPRSPQLIRDTLRLQAQEEELALMKLSAMVTQRILEALRKRHIDATLY